MSLPYKHMMQQGPTLASLGNVLFRGMGQQMGIVKTSWKPSPAELPGPENHQVVPPRTPSLVRDYIRSIGGDPALYKGHLPPHLCTQWFFPIAEKTLRGLDYPLFKMVNAGCRMEFNGPLPASMPLRVAARLDSIDDDGRRVLIRQRVATGTTEHPELVVAWVTTVTPLSGASKKKKGKKKEPARVAAGAKELAFWKLPADAGLSFAMLTGDFNPIHWLAPYAKAFGHKNTILHGFATLARAIEGLNRGLYSGDTGRLAWIDSRFTRPLVLPARIGLYLDDDTLFVGDGPGGPAYLVATFATKETGQ